MKLVTIKCDRCGDSISDGRILLEVKTGPARLVTPEHDLCSTCYAAFARWLAAGIEAQDSTANKPEPAETP